MGIGRRLAKLNPPSSRKAMIEVDFGVYLSVHEPKPTATQSSQTLGYFKILFSQLRSNFGTRQICPFFRFIHRVACGMIF
jgi:hypothetical protein